MKRSLMMTMLVLILSACGAQSATSPTTAPATTAPTTPPATVEPTVDLGAMEIKLMPIESVAVNIMESDPVQVAAEISGTLRDGCTEFKDATQTRNGNTITITVNTMRPKDMMCTQDIRFYSTTIKLDGAFPAGNYTVKVNDVEQTFTVK